tara:strand:- start:133 stop:330 length:198 start_codon:yes stop_codon:yes gene_type:complete
MQQEVLRGGMKTLDQFCADNGVSRAQAYLEHKSGKLPFTKLGRATRIKLEDEQAWRDSLPVVGAA